MLRGEEFKHAARVSRVRPGDVVALLDGRGGTYEARVARVGAREVALEVLSREQAREGSRVDIALAVIKAPRFDLAVEKCTELGVRRLIPFIAERGLWRGKDAESGLKVERIRRKIVASCKQSGQPFFPEIAAPATVEELIEQIPSYSAVFLAEQDSEAREARAPKAGANPVLGIVGPEGGLTPREREGLISRGAIPVSLGPFRLRTETAAICLSYRLLSDSARILAE
jgi:16S rRNA (uracil1498-N3)-methyltransferase